MTTNTTFTTELQEHLFGIPLTTHRNPYNGEFPYELWIAGIAIFFFRTTIPALPPPKEPRTLRWFFGFLLAFLAYSNKSYELIMAVEVFSYAVPMCLYAEWPLYWFHRLYRFLIGFTSHTPTPTTTTPPSTSTTTFTKSPSPKGTTTISSTSTTKLESGCKIFRLALIALSAGVSLLVSHVLATGILWEWIHWLLPSTHVIWDGIASFVPTREVRAAYEILDQFVLEPGLLNHHIARLFFVTFHIQCAIGYLGISFLKEEQQRRNELVRMDMTKGDYDDDDTTNNVDNNNNSSKPTSTLTPPTTTTTPTTSSIPVANGNHVNHGASARPSHASSSSSSVEDPKRLEQRLNKSRRFQRTAAPFILYTAVPYMIKIILFGNVNAFAFSCFQDDIHRAVRLYDLFEHDNHLVAVAEHSATSPEAYATYMDTIVSTTYTLFNRKLFSLPKVMLLPMVMARQPKMMAQIFPIIFLTDWIKGRAVTYMTARIEQLQKEVQEISAIRSKVEAFDIKNAELLQRAGATDFTKRRWEELTVKVQMKTVVKELTSRTKDFFAFIQRNWVFTVLVDCALAHLIAVGKLVAADVFVFSRAIEDAVDMALMKSRSEAELARMMTQIDKMKELNTVWENAKTRNLIHCNVAPSFIPEHASETHASMIVLRNLLYSRGTALVRVDHLELPAGIYALTGANGSGKSTLFRVLMSCDTNERSIDLPSSIVLSTPNEPIIIEKDDVEREILCETADEAAERIQIDIDNNNNKKQDNSIHPRLSITMPSSRVVEISQTFYWPLYSKPIDWIFQEHIADTCTTQDLQLRARRVAEELHSLEFAQSLADPTAVEGHQVDDGDRNRSEDVIVGIMEQLLEEKEDWFGDLSGGQKSKVELVRKVFLQDQCPHVLLVDETMAPLDPRSKALVMSKIKAFCANSVVIVIYHTDVGRETQGEGGDIVECVPRNDFFDGNIHVEHKTIHLRPVC